jgi:hypothetical protein
MTLKRGLRLVRVFGTIDAPPVGREPRGWADVRLSITGR